MGDSDRYRREMLEGLGLASLAAVVGAAAAPRQAAAAQPKAARKWEPVSDRKIRFGIVGYGVCRFGAAFGFQNHPNVQIVAVSDLIPDRRSGLMKACRCDKSYESLEVLVKDPRSRPSLSRPTRPATRATASSA